MHPVANIASPFRASELAQLPQLLSKKGFPVFELPDFDQPILRVGLPQSYSAFACCFRHLWDTSMQNINLSLCHLLHETQVTRLCDFACAQIRIGTFCDSFCFFLGIVIAKNLCAKFGRNKSNGLAGYEVHLHIYIYINKHTQKQSSLIWCVCVCVCVCIQLVILLILQILVSTLACSAVLFVLAQTCRILLSQVLC